MAELTSSRMGKSAPRVDLTAMVDLAFLLITFFMLTTSLSKPMAMEIAKPVDSANKMALPASRTMTIILCKNNKIAWYMGEPGKSEPTISGFDKIRREILNNKAKVGAANGNDPERSLLVIIKPTAEANYKNFVDIMDELNLVRLIYAPSIDDEHFTLAEQAFLEKLQ